MPWSTRRDSRGFSLQQCVQGQSPGSGEAELAPLEPASVPAVTGSVMSPSRRVEEFGCSLCSSVFPQMQGEQLSDCPAV